MAFLQGVAHFGQGSLGGGAGDRAAFDLIFRGHCLGSTIFPFTG